MYEKELKFAKDTVKLAGNILEYYFKKHSERRDLKVDFINSEKGNDVALRLQIKDIETDEIKATASIDVEGNCFLNFKSINIEVDADGFNVNYRE